MAAAATSVGQLLTIAQDSAAASERCAASVWRLALSDPDATFGALQACADHLVALPQKSVFVDRSVRFFGHLAARAPPGSEAAAAVLEELLSHLCSRLQALDKAVRLRAAQLLRALLAGLPQGLALDAAVAQQLRGALCERLRDKAPAVRAEAVRALCLLAADDDDGDGDGDDNGSNGSESGGADAGSGASSVASQALALLQVDKSKDVRVAVVLALPLSSDTLQPLLERLRDVSPVVRKAVVQRLAGLPIRMLSIKQRAEVVLQVLTDRDELVTDAASKLLGAWLAADCGGDPLALLQLLDVETYAEAGVAAVESLISSISIQPPAGSSSSRGGRGVIAYVEAAAGGAGGLPSLAALAEVAAGPQQRLLQPHEALMWRCLCEWLRTDAISKGLAAAATGGARAVVQAAVAVEHHEVLERVLPESADRLMQLIMAHAAAGPAARFASTQLLMVASTCMEWTDAASRAMAEPVLQQLLGLSTTAAAEQGDTSCADGSAADEAACCGMPLAGNGGDGSFEAAVTGLVLAVQGGCGPAFVSAMLEGVALLATGAGLLGKPADGGGGACFAVGGAEPTRVLQCLAYVQLLLQQLPSGQLAVDDSSSSSGGLGFSALWELLLLLALKQDVPAIRAKAVECVGLYALAAATPGLLSSAVQLLAPLAAAGGDSTTRAAAAKALSDIALLCGPAAVDAVLRDAPVVAAAAAAGTASGTDGSSGSGIAAGLSGGCGGSSCLLGLLLGQAEELLAAAQALVLPAAGTKAKRGGRAAAPGRAATTPALPAHTAELLATLAEALAKLLLHQRAWLRRYALPAAPGWVAPPLGGGGDGGAQLDAQLSDAQQQQARLLRRALSLLLLLQFHLATEGADRLRQILPVFFDAFASAAGPAVAAQHRLQLVTAVLPAAQQALNLACKKQPAPLLLKFVMQLLQAGAAQAGAAAAAPPPPPLLLPGESVASLALLLLREADELLPRAPPSKVKPYLAALLKLVCELPLEGGCSAQELAALQAAADRLAADVADATLAKDVAALQALLGRAAGAAGLQEQLTPEALRQLEQQLQGLGLQRWAPAAAAPVAGGAAGGSRRKPAAAGGTTRRGVRAAAAARDSSGSDSDSDAAAHSGGDSSSSGGEQAGAAAGVRGQQAAVASAVVGAAAGRRGRRAGKTCAAGAAAAATAPGARASDSDSEATDSAALDGSSSSNSSGDEAACEDAAAPAGGSGKAAAVGGADRGGGRVSTASSTLVPRAPLQPSSIVNSR